VGYPQNPAIKRGSKKNDTVKTGGEPEEAESQGILGRQGRRRGGGKTEQAGRESERDRAGSTGDEVRGGKGRAG